MRTSTNPGTITPLRKALGVEKYTVLQANKIVFYRRTEAIEATRVKAVEKQRSFTIRLNGVNFCQIDKTGTCDYIYDPSKDNVSSPALKQLMRRLNISVN